MLYSRGEACAVVPTRMFHIRFFKARLCSAGCADALMQALSEVFAVQLLPGLRHDSALAYHFALSITMLVSSLSLHAPQSCKPSFCSHDTAQSRHFEYDGLYREASVWLI